VLQRVLFEVVESVAWVGSVCVYEQFSRSSHARSNPQLHGLIAPLLTWPQIALWA